MSVQLTRAHQPSAANVAQALDQKPTPTQTSALDRSARTRTPIVRRPLVDTPRDAPATPLRARTVLVRRLPRQASAASSHHVQREHQRRTELLATWCMATPPSTADQERLRQRLAGLQALYASAPPELIAEFEARVPSLLSLAAMPPAEQRCAHLLHSLERQALWSKALRSGVRRDALVHAYAQASRPLGTGPLNAIEGRLREALMRALASLMTPGLRMATLQQACHQPWPGLGDAKSTASRDLLRRTFWSLFDAMKPEELARADVQLADLKKAFNAAVARDKFAAGNAAQADRIMLLEHALAYSRSSRASRRLDDESSDLARQRLVNHYLKRPDLRRQDFDAACDPAPLLRLEPDALEPTLEWRALQIQVLTTLMTPASRRLSLENAARQYGRAPATWTPRSEAVDEHQVRQRLMQERLLALFGAMTPGELEWAKSYLAELDHQRATASASPSSPSLREQNAQAKFLKLCDETLKTVLHPVRGVRDVRER